MFVQGYVTVFLCLCDLVSKGTPQRLLRLTMLLKVWGDIQTCTLLSLLRMYRIYFGRAKFLIITFKIILQVLEMDMAVSAIIE